MENLNLLFYKTFYTKLGDDTLVERNVTAFEKDITTKSKRLVDSKFYSDDYKAICDQIAKHKFQLKTLYPGLLVGTGYAHGVDSKDDIKLGFSFDYVSGQPYIPGSSVKGLLKSYFAHPEVIRCFLADEEIDVKALEKSIFGTCDANADDGIDTFFDAIVRCGNKDGNVMGFDAITPHGTDLTKNPVPIKLLKIMPDVVLEFAFNLKDSVINGKKITAEQKKDLFEKLLVNFGIGAKTNVGYGVLVPIEQNELENYKYPEKKTKAEAVVVQKKSIEVESPVGAQSAEIGKFYNCTVTGVKDFGIFVRIDNTSVSGLIHSSKLKEKKCSDFTVGCEIIAKCLGKSEKGFSFAFGEFR